MAAINVVLNGVFTTDAGAATGSFVGQMAYSDRAPGGGPIVPPSGAHPEHPIHYPPGSLPHPEHPIHYPPGSLPHPEHPIAQPPEGPPPEGPPDQDGFIKPPPAAGGWAYHEKYEWMYDPPAGAAQPK